MLAKLLLALAVGTAPAQQPVQMPAQQPVQQIAQPPDAPAHVGFVPAEDASVSGEISIAEGKIALGNSSVVTAKDRTATVSLERGGTVDVCQSSSLHLTKGNGGPGLLLALDRGALELHLDAGTNDSLMTPDLRFALSAAGPLDLRLRVTRSGDTCVENRGTDAPAISITDVFGDTFYVVQPGQHVLFEHGHLNEVVDHERTPCGCPAPPPATTSIAEAIISGKPTPAQAEALHPFPAAVSEGLAEPTPLPAKPAGVAHAQVSAALAYNADPTPEPAPLIPAPSPPPPPQHRGIFHTIGHFFQRVFGTA